MKIAAQPHQLHRLHYQHTIRPDTKGNLAISARKDYLANPKSSRITKGAGFSGLLYTAIFYHYHPRLLTGSRSKETNG
jgi:hypothetical protein